MLRSDLGADSPGVFATITADALFTDDGVRPGRSYVYRVVAVNDDGDSPNSDPITVDTPAEPQTDTTVPEPTLVEVVEPPLIPSLQLQGQTPTEFVVTTEVTSNTITGPYQQLALHDTIWSATLTVGELSTLTGNRLGYAVNSTGSLSNTMFDYHRTQVTVLLLFSAPSLDRMSFTVAAPDGGSDLDPGAVLTMGDTHYSVGSAATVTHTTQTVDGVATPATGYTWTVESGATLPGLVDGETVDVSLTGPAIFGPDGIPVSGRLTASAASDPEDEGWTSHTYPTACRKLFPDHAPGRMRLGSSYLGCARDLESQWFVVNLQQHRNYEIEILTDAGARLVPDLNHAHHPADPTYRFIWGGRRYEQCERVRVEGRNRTYCRWGRDWLRVYTQRGGEHLIKVANGSHGITNPDYRIRVREQ